MFEVAESVNLHNSLTAKRLTKEHYELCLLTCR